ncbi:hypothetical protein PYW07_001634 [Mythimna separata]|uniref:RHD domain-containing protein n=1 Tax=Mythimna separata TaxID=271217 RepID=A0AAD7YVM7_MYTSE|nr:hypothetical protein PYW07_001634 [Mythimna separata]
MSTSASSDHDMSDSSSSPMSYIRYSPHSSPSQQVPQLATDLTELSCADNKRQFFRQANKPCLRITEQPQNHFRFRYVSEMVGTHGCLLGKSVGPNKQKTHPTVELLNYSGKALIRCRLAQHNNPDEHPHKLLEDDQQDRDMSYLVPDQDSYKVGFGGIGIIHTAKKDVSALLFKKFSERCKNNMNLNDLKMQCDNMAKTINLNIVRLKFSAHDTVTGQEICEPVFSEPIHNMKSAATNDLKISRISRSSGSASGGEDVFILVEKVNKKNIMIRFFELDDNNERCWTGAGQFMQSDVHHQYAIVFRTPPYKNPETPVDVHVFIELVRPSDGRTSEPKEFKYKANQAYKQIKKRKAGSSYCSIGSSSSGSLTSGSGIPLTIVNHQPEEPMDPVPDQSYILPQMQGLIPSNQCDLANALYSAPGSEMSQTPLSSPMWSNSPHSVLLPEPPIADLHLDSTELEQITLPNSALANQSPEEMKSFFNEYLRSYGESLPEVNSMEFLRASLVPDSGRAKPQPNQIRFQGDRAQVNNQSKEADIKGDIKQQKNEYPAFYKTEDGIEVKKLVKDLCEMIRNKKGFKKAEVRSRLERLFEIRLSNGDTFLHMTLCSNQPSLEYIVKIIHSVKATHLLDCTNDRQQTTLHLAVLNDMPKMVALFIAKGSSPMMKDDKDLNVVHYAVKYRSCLGVLLDSIKKNEVSCDLNDYNGDNQSALHMAVVSGWEQGTRLLLQHGASFSVRDAEGRTPLHLAAYDDRLAIMKILLEFIPSSEIDVMDNAGNTALQIVCGGTTVNKNSVEIARLLLDKKAYPLKHEDSNESAWRLVKTKPELRELMKAYVTVECMDEDEIKSEPEDDFESADEGDYAEIGLQDMNLYAREVSVLVDQAGVWRVLAQRLNLDTLLEWYAAQPSPTLTLLKHLKDSRDDISSKSLAMILEDMGQTEAASVIRRCID